MKNTEYEVKFVDLIAFEQLLESNSNIYLSNSIQSWNRDKNNRVLKVIFYRYSMDENGYHNGYEYYTAKWKMFNKLDFNIAVGVPINIFPYVIIPNAFEIVKIEGAEKNHKFYCKPDSDFVWQEIDHWLRENLPNLLEAEFNEGERSWECGYFKEYLDSVKSSI